jgi:two-component system cell cycle response regulator DivK
MAGDHVLVVEDNERNMKLLRDVLSASGYRALEATTGADAVELVGRHQLDLVLLDVQLPDLDGVDVLRVIRTDARTALLPVVAVTAQAMDGDRERFLRAGFDEYLPKPVDVRELLDVVQRLCAPVGGRSPRTAD